MANSPYLTLLNEVPDITSPNWKPSDTEQYFERVEDAIKTVKAQMIPGVHFVDCGWSRPRLLTTGADLLAKEFGLEPRYNVESTFPIPDSSADEICIQCAIVHCMSGRELTVEFGVSESREMAEERAYVDAIIGATLSREHFAEELGDELL